MVEQTIAGHQHTFSVRPNRLGGCYTLQDVVKTTVFLADMNEFAAMNAVYANYFDEATAPARVCVQVSQLPKDVLVEIDCIAVIEPK